MACLVRLRILGIEIDPEIFPLRFLAQVPPSAAELTVEIDTCFRMRNNYSSLIQKRSAGFPYEARHADPAAEFPCTTNPKPSGALPALSSGMVSALSGDLASARIGGQGQFETHIDN
jgi:hypothetical protein